MKKLVMGGALLALAVAVLVWPVKAWLASSAKQVVVVSKHDEATVRVNEATFDPEDLTPQELREEVIAIYGTKLSEEAVLFVDDAKVLRPKQVSDLTLFLKSADENPLKMDTIHWAAPKVSIGAAVVALLLFGVTRLLSRRAATS